MLLQTGFHIRAVALRPQWSRLSPRAGLSRLLGRQGLAEAGTSIPKLLAGGAALYWALAPEAATLDALAFQDMGALLSRLLAASARALGAALAVQGAFALADQQRARRRMLAQVAKATVVITNPTHYAVALAYERGENAAPRVVAKGVDAVAARIREEAQRHRVPLVANPPLARALHRVELDAEIPAEFFQAVAEIVAYVWRLRGRAA